MSSDDAKKLSSHQADYELNKKKPELPEGYEPDQLLPSKKELLDVEPGQRAKEHDNEEQPS